ncbi:hypothetical protein HYFRA_00011429 [Hymenoscyphus fraxineus]|uniref:BRCT domain-containing protein n=1 Tax=Hymenoscyphus fraxineus TaxID=746836 RepID=A0A9N9L3F3_9HELO|nr:hypothetical protein HYFRA_00011429 [Hymenoscyphus fraxineus]
MPPSKPKTAAQPKFGSYFDAWNSSSTGHQRAENRLGGSTGWRQSRNMKLSHQFKGGNSGGKRISDAVGAGSEDWDEKAQAVIPKDVRQRAKLSVRDMLTAGAQKTDSLSGEEKLMASRKKEDDMKEEAKRNRTKQVFDGLVLYINGSTHPMISDHKLKHVLAENGAKVSLHMARKQVTHVILGRPSGMQIGAGGGLSGSKLEKEIKRVGGCGIKFVGVEWVLDSLKAGKRLPESQYSNLKVAAKSQQSVYGFFQKNAGPAPSAGVKDSLKPGECERPW